MNTVKRYKQYKLDNGLVVALQNTPTETIAGRLNVWHGALNEMEGEEGLVHFVEHVILDGSRKYSFEQALRIIDSFGFFNAETQLDKTIFPVDLLSEDIELYLDFISDAVFHPSFHLEKVEQERQRIIREISDNEGYPAFEDLRITNEAYYGKNSQYTYYIGGKEEVIRNSTIDDLRRVHRRGYHPNNMNLILVGGLPRNIEELIEKYFGHIHIRGGERVTFIPNKPLTEKTIFHTYAPDLYNKQNPEESSAALYIKIYAPTKLTDDEISFAVLDSILGGGWKSLLFQEISQKKGLAYYIKSSYNREHNQGILKIRSDIHANRLEETINSIFEQLSFLKNNLVSQEEIDRIKKKTKYYFAKHFETNEGRGSLIEMEMKCYNYGYIMSELDKVTPKRILEVANKYLPDRDGNYVLLLRDPLKK